MFDSFNLLLCMMEISVVAILTCTPSQTWVERESRQDEPERRGRKMFWSAQRKRKRKRKGGEWGQVVGEGGSERGREGGGRKRERRLQGCIELEEENRKRVIMSLFPVSLGRRLLIGWWRVCLHCDLSF